MKTSPLLSLLFCLLLMPACKSGKKPSEEVLPATGTNQIGVISYPLIGTKWLLIELDGKIISKDQGPNTLPFIEFMETSMAADDGCNRLFGPIEIQEGNLIHFGQLGSSMRACPGQTLEGPFRRALENCDNYSIQGSFLSLIKGKSKILARFEAKAVSGKDRRAHV